jgi:hypothetical protein
MVASWWLWLLVGLGIVLFPVFFLVFFMGVA